MTLPDDPDNVTCEALPAGDGLHTLTISFPMAVEYGAGIKAELSAQVENSATVASKLLVQLEVIEAGLQQMSVWADPMADIAILLRGATEATNLAKRELGSENPRIDVIRLCALVLKWVATKGDVLVDAVLKGAGTTVGIEIIHKLLGVDLAAAVVQLEHWLQLQI